MNKQSGILYAGFLALTLLLSGCTPAPTATPAPTTLRTLPPTATVPAAAASTAVPTAVPTIAPTRPPAATATKAATPTVVPATTPTLPPTATAAATKTAGGPKEDCLACHGPFDTRVSATANYSAWPFGGDKQSPHRYVPHDSKEIPECTNCHTAHPIPPTAADIAAMAKPDPKWCYGCHHAGVLKCGTCHPVPEAEVTSKP